MRLVPQNILKTYIEIYSQYTPIAIMPIKSHDILTFEAPAQILAATQAPGINGNLLLARYENRSLKGRTGPAG